MERYTEVVQDRRGNAIQNATVTVYNYDGTTLAAIYSDNGVTVIASSQVTTDVNGEFYFYAADGIYDLHIAGSGIAERWLRGVQLRDLTGYVYDVTSFGAVGDGATDDTVAIQAAIDAAEANRGEVKFPQGVYLITDALEASTGIKITGAGRGSSDSPLIPDDYTGTVIKAGPGVYSAVFYFTAKALGAHISDIAFKMDDAWIPHPMTAIHFRFGAKECVVERVVIRGHVGLLDIGVRIDGEDPALNGTRSYNNMVADSYLYKLYYGVWLNGVAAAGKYINRNNVCNCTFETCDVANVRVDNGSNILIMGNNFNPNGTPANGYVQLDGPYSSCVSVCNYFDTVGVGDYAIVVTNYAHTELNSPVYVFGDNQPFEKYNCNLGNAVGFSAGECKLPNIATANITASPTNGLMYYDITLNAFRVYENGAWRNM